MPQFEQTVSVLLLLPDDPPVEARRLLASNLAGGGSMYAAEDGGPKLTERVESVSLSSPVSTVSTEKGRRVCCWDANA